MAKITYRYSVKEGSENKTIYTRPCEWNKTGIFTLNAVTQKDLAYLCDVIGIKGIEKTEVQKKKDVTVTEQNIQDNN